MAEKLNSYQKALLLASSSTIAGVAAREVKALNAFAGHVLSQTEADVAKGGLSLATATLAFLAVRQYFRGNRSANNAPNVPHE